MIQALNNICHLDRFDCQFLMATFAYIYHESFIKVCMYMNARHGPYPQQGHNVDKLLMAVLSLDEDAQRMV